MSFVPRIPSSEDYDCSSTDSEHVRSRARLRAPFDQLVAADSIPASPNVFLFPSATRSGRSSQSSTATSTPLPSRSTSPLPQFYPAGSSSECPSDSDSEPGSPLVRMIDQNRRPWWRENRRRWWNISRRRRKRDGRIVRTIKKLLRPLVRHPLFPGQPITIVLTLILLSIFAIFLTLLLIYILNPDKEPLPWRAYCAAPSLTSAFEYTNFTTGPPVIPIPFSDLETLPPAGVFVGVFSIDSAFERRMLVRTTWGSHPRSRNGANNADDGLGTSRTVVRFILGQPQKDWERRIQLEMETYNDIVILPIQENMNWGKTHTYFTWASISAWVPPLYFNSTVPALQFSYTHQTTTPPSLAPHDSFQAWTSNQSGKPKAWVRPDYVVKVDDDSFVMLAELEARLRLELHAKKVASHETASTRGWAEHQGTIQKNLSSSAITDVSADPRPSAELDPLIYWGYRVNNRLHEFMAGELYALSWSLVDWVAKDPGPKALTRGAEDKQTAKWMRIHPRASEIRWASEHCWIYDHPRSGTVYSHGFLYPSEVTRVKRSMKPYLDQPQGILTMVAGGSKPPTPAAWAHSSVSTFNVRYSPPLPDLSIPHSVEALVEGSVMSTLREGNPMTPEHAWKHREGRQVRYEEHRVGGTVVVHFIKKNMWYLETALALLEGEEQSEAERYESLQAIVNPIPLPTQSHVIRRSQFKNKRQ